MENTGFKIESCIFYFISLLSCDKKSGARLPVAFFFQITENRKNPGEGSCRNSYGECQITNFRADTQVSASDTPFETVSRHF